MTALIELYKANTHAELVEWLVREYGIANSAIQTMPSNAHEAIAKALTPAVSNKHLARRQEMAQRVRLYRDDYADDMADVIDMIWTRSDYREKMKSYIGAAIQGGPEGGVATQQNVTARIVNEVASLYDKPAKRTVAPSGSPTQTKFKAEEKRLRLHEITQDYHRLLWLCNEVLVWQFEGVDDKTKLKVVTPDLFDAVAHPRDKTVMAGVILQAPRITMAPPQVAAQTQPMYEIWDDTYTYLLNSQGKMIDETGQPVEKPTEHGLGRIPGVLLHRREPSDRCLDPRPGRDIAAAHRGVCLLNIMLIKLSKEQGEQQPVLQGNLAIGAKNQTADGEIPWVLPPEGTAELLNTVTNPDHLIKVKAEALRSVGMTYGVSYEEETTATADSAKVYQARREKLSELRTEQTRRAIVNETEVVDLIGSPTDALKVDHREQALPQNPTDAMALLDMRVRLGMDSPIKALMREDPDLEVEDAIALVRENMAEWATVIQVIRALNIPGTATATDPGNDPTINGAGKIVEKISPDSLVGNTAQPAPQQSMPVNAPPPRK